VKWQVSVVAVSSSVIYPTVDRCKFDRLMPLSYETKLYLADFIDKLHREHCSYSFSHDCVICPVFETRGKSRG